MKRVTTLEMKQRSQTVAEQLRALIMSGAIAPGEELLEIPTAARLGISRTPLRPALAALAQEGLLQRRGARGYVVRKVSAREVLDAYVVRAHLEGIACSIVARQGLSDDLRRRLREILEHGDALLRAGVTTDEARQNWREMNEDFHRLILENTGNACLIDVTARTLSLPFLSSRVAHFDNHAALVRSHDDHWGIFKAMNDGDSARAGAIMQEHILRSRDVIERRYLSSGAEDLKPA
jgi:GntR family transcriptional regulator of vanillate catabolism